METKNIFDEIGRRVPYGVPNNFFDTITEKTLQKAKKEKGKKNLIRFLIPFSAAASILIILTVGLLFKGQLTTKDLVQSQKNTIENKELKNPDTLTITEKNTPLDTGIKTGKEHNQTITEKPLTEETLENLLAQLTNEELSGISESISAEIYIEEINNDK